MGNVLVDFLFGIAKIKKLEENIKEIIFEVF